MAGKNVVCSISSNAMAVTRITGHDYKYREPAHFFIACPAKNCLCVTWVYIQFIVHLVHQVLQKPLNFAYQLNSIYSPEWPCCI